MCQGCIVSLVKFKPAGKRTKSIVLKGIGSHSQLVSDNLAKLTKAGWNENLPGQKVYSIESDFSAWNKFTLVSGEPDKTELKILKAAYKEIAGSPSALIRHVLKCNKLDDALVALLAAPADKAWQEATAPADKAYREAKAPADKAWQEATATADKAYREATAPADKAWQEAIATADKAYREATATADKAWQEAIAPADKAWQEATAPADKAWQEAKATADKAWQEAKVHAWVSLFRKPSNRIKCLQ